MLLTSMNAHALDNVRPRRWKDKVDLSEKEQGLEINFPETPDEKERREIFEKELKEREDAKLKKEKEIEDKIGLKKVQGRCDLVIIGGGYTGLHAAMEASKLGATTAIIEKNFIGGINLHSATMPSKVLLNSAALVHTASNCSDVGL